MVLAHPAAAQDGAYGPADERAPAAEPSVADTRAAWSTAPRPKPSECAQARAEADEETIVVCREWESGERYMLGERERRQVGADVRDTAGGAPRAPDMDESCLHTRGRENCMMGGWVPPPAIMVDFSTLPETPPDSDAARLYDGPVAGVAQVEGTEP